MTKLDTGSYKGVRDFYPEDQFIENYIFGVWRQTLMSFGYEEYHASVLEPSELYRAKSGNEIVNEQTYSFIDRGEREVTLRPEMTPTVARMVAGKRRELAFPLRWYSIPNLFRYEAPQRGRLREHWQLNADIFGVENTGADTEILKIAHTLMVNFGASEADFEIRLNDIEALKKYLLNQGVSEEKLDEARRLIDKKNKIPNFEEEMRNLIGKEIDLNFPISERIKAVLELLKEEGVTNARFDPTLSRGFDYYTGMVFEVFDTNPENPRSLFGGGRYDSLTSMFGNDEVPAVGFGAGDVTMRQFLEVRNLLPTYPGASDIVVIPLNSKYFSEALRVSKELRATGKRVAVDWSERKVGDEIKTADKQGVKYILVIGEDEAISKTYKLKDLKTGEEKIGSTELLKLELNK